MALTTNKISLKNIISKVYRDLDINEEYDVINIVEWGVEALRFINAFEQYEIKKECLKINNCRAELPCDFVALLSVEHNGIQLDRGSNNKIFDTTRGNYTTKPYSYNLSQMDSLPLKLGKLYTLGDKDNFIVENGWIKTSFEKGDVNIEYNSVPTDEDGIPLIPDDESYRAAITWYINMKYFYTKAIKEDRYRWFYQDAEVKWNKYCNQSGAKAMMPDIFTLENIKRNYISLLPSTSSYKVNFNDLNQ